MAQRIDNGRAHIPSMDAKVESFHTELAPYFTTGFRVLPWRHLSTNDAERFYQVLVSELMLQQTQVSRVIDSYLSWNRRFPDIETLAKAPFRDVLGEWAGLGYSRRAKYLQDIAQALVGASLPMTIEELVAFKGIGVNTAGAILAYYNNLPAVFIETNVRTVLFHHFFEDQESVDDRELYELIGRLIDTKNPRSWYWAIMDYGAYLKRSIRNNSMSRHYTKQSVFEGSDRQLRSYLLKRLIIGPCTEKEALYFVGSKLFIIEGLQKDGMIDYSDGIIVLAK